MIRARPHGDGYVYTTDWLSEPVPEGSSGPVPREPASREVNIARAILGDGLDYRGPRTEMGGGHPHSIDLLRMGGVPIHAPPKN